MNNEQPDTENQPKTKIDVPPPNEATNEEKKKDEKGDQLVQNNDQEDIGKSKKDKAGESDYDDPKNQVLGIDRRLWYIFIWELIGTFIFAWGINASKGNDFFISASLFGAIILTANFTGGHVNPAVSTAFYCLQSSQMTISTHEYITYMTAQFSGAFIGGFFAWGVLKDINSPYPADETAFWVMRDIMGQIFGTFTFVLIILILCNPKTNFTRHPILKILTICAGLTFSRSFTYHSGGVLNPGVALGLQFFRSLSTFDFTPMVHAYIYIFGPIVGAILSALFYTNVYLTFLQPRADKKEKQPVNTA